MGTSRGRDCDTLKSYRSLPPSPGTRGGGASSTHNQARGEWQRSIASCSAHSGRLRGRTRLRYVAAVGPGDGSGVGALVGEAPMQMPEVHTSLTVNGSLSSHLGAYEVMFWSESFACLAVNGSPITFLKW